MGVKKRIGLLIILIGCSLVVSIGTADRSLGQLSCNSADLKSVQNQAHPSFFNEQYFYRGINQVQENDSFDGRVGGGVVPHHDLAGVLIADFFQKLSSQNPKTIILLGPDHQNTASAKAVSSLYNWETPFGWVESDPEIINELINQKLIQVDESTLSKEHSIGTITPYIRYHLPEAKIVPIVLNKKFDERDAQELAQFLAKHLDDETVLVAAVDFSHYLTAQEAQEKDELTIEVIRNFDLATLFSFKDDHLDSAPAIGTLLSVMESLGAESVKIINHANSNDFLKQNQARTTSYFTLTFH